MTVSALEATAVLPTGRTTTTIDCFGQDHQHALVTLDFDPIGHSSVPARLARRIDRFSAIAIIGVAKLLERTSDVLQDVPADRIGLFLANTAAGWGYGEEQLGLFVEGGIKAMHTYQATAWFPAAAQGEVSIALQILGHAKTTAGSERGFSEALMLAEAAIRLGRVSYAIVGVAESINSSFGLAGHVGGCPHAEPFVCEGGVFMLIGPEGMDRPQLTASTHASEQLGARSTPGIWPAALAEAIAILDRPCPKSTQNGTNVRRIESSDVISKTARHHIEIDDHAASAFDLCRSVELWPQFMPAVRSARYITTAAPGGIEEIELTAEAGSEIHTWRSYRVVDSDKLEVRFHRHDPVPPLLRMEGTWRFEPTSDRTCTVQLTHSFSMTDPGRVDGLLSAIRANATRDLAGMKAHLEGTLGD